MKSQKIDRSTKKKQTTIISEKTPKPAPEVKSTRPGVALRVVNYVEVGEMSGGQVQLMMQELNATYDRAQGGIHYFLPIRHGKIGTDLIFEQEWLAKARELCEVDENGEIQLKGGCRDVEIVRRKI